VHLKEGVTDAEKELGIDIGFSEDLEKKASILADRQLEGFYIEGKRWNGIKGLSAEVQDQVSNVVRKGIVDKQSLKDIKTNIKGVMEGYLGTDVSEGRVMRIARTETNRFHNAAKTQAYRESGLDGVVVWDAFHDNRTSEVCERLNGQKVAPGQPFVDPKTGKAYEHAPAHPNCRSTVRFELI